MMIRDRRVSILKREFDCIVGRESRDSGLMSTTEFLEM